MYDDRLKEEIEKTPVRLFQRALIKEWDYQKGLPENGVWLFCFSQVLKNVLRLSDRQKIRFRLEEVNPQDLVAEIFKEIDHQQNLMETEQGKRTNFYRPFCSLIWAVLERAQDGN